MDTQYTQIKINLPTNLAAYLRTKAEKYGLPTAGYIKHLVLKDVENVDYPTFEASDRVIKKAKKALKEKPIEVNDLDKFFREL